MGILARHKLGKIYRKFFVNKPTGLDIFIYAAMLLLCYFVFNQTDLLETGGSSFTYLNGHIKDFYEINDVLVGGNLYLPSTYMLFAVWNIPVKLLGIVNQATLDVGYVIFWYKLLTTLFFAGSAYWLYKIGRVIGLNKVNSALLTAIWISSPILFFSQFIFGQYDIFCAFFVLAGLFYFLKKNIWAFILFFGISITFKYFPIFIFVPLLLLVEKNPGKILLFAVSVAAFICLQVLFHAGSSLFQTNVVGFGVATLHLESSFITVWRTNNCLFLLSWFIISGLCYYAEPIMDKNKFYQTVFYICLLVFGSLFTFIHWNPQWLLLITPFLAITTFMHRKIREFLFLDFIMMIAFVGFTVSTWQMNADQQMFSLGVLARLNPNLFDPGKTFLMAKIFVFGTSMYLTLFNSILILNILCKFPNKTNRWNGDEGLAGVDAYWNYARLRFIGGLAIFIIPAFISFFYTLKATPPLSEANSPYNRSAEKLK